MRYNPYKQFTGAFIPSWLMERTEIGPIAKLVFARLAQYAGKDGSAFPAQDTLAIEIGVSLRTVERAIKELLAAKLLQSERRNMGQSNAYYFLRHAWTPTDNMAEPTRQNDGQEPPPLAELHTEKRIKEENQSSCSLKANAVLMPEELNSPAFDVAWSEWVSYRKQIKKPMPLSTISRQLKMLASLGCENAILSIEQSIAGGWYGLFAPKEALRFAVKGPAPITNDGIWQGYLDSLCREWHPGKPDVKYAENALRRARGHVGCPEIRDYLRYAYGHVLSEWEAILEGIK